MYWETIESYKAPGGTPTTPKTQRCRIFKGWLVQTLSSAGTVRGLTFIEDQRGEWKID